MRVHLLLDVSNIISSWPNGRDVAPLDLLTHVDLFVLGDRETGRCRLVRSKHIDIEAMSARDGAIMDLVERGYTDICLPLASQQVACPCGREFTRLYEKTVDARLISELYQTARKAEEGDTIALVSGDSDFAEAMFDVGEAYGVNLEVWSFTQSASGIYRGGQKVEFHPLDMLMDRAA